MKVAVDLDNVITDLLSELISSEIQEDTEDWFEPFVAKFHINVKSLSKTLR